MTTSTGLWAAGIAAAVAIIVAVLTQLWTGRREQRGRASMFRRDSLRAAQNAALELRNRLAEFGPVARQESGAASMELQQAQVQVDEAFAQLDVAMTRVDNPELSDAVTAWRQRARFHYVSAEEVTTDEERRLWEAMNDQFGTALRDADNPGAGNLGSG